MLSKISDKIDDVFSKLEKYFRSNLNVLLFILVIAIFTYGFELFNINLTIDEEMASALTSVDLGRLSNGRWGLFLINKLLLPFSVIPFVPLAISILFQLTSIMLIFESLAFKNNILKALIGAMFISWPGMAFMYSFSTGNYGIGFGFLCIGLSLYLFTKNLGLAKYWAVIPSIFVVSVYEPLIPALLAVFILYLLLNWDNLGKKIIIEFIRIIMILIISIIGYLIISKILLLLFNLPKANYVSHYFDISYLFENFIWISKKLFRLIINVFMGDKSIYGLEIRSFGVLVIFLGFVIFVSNLLSKRNVICKIFWILLVLAFVLLPFLGGFITKGYIPKRSLVSIPIIVAGLSILGLTKTSKPLFYLLVFLSSICLFQFVSSSNHLYASSYFALEEDKFLASQLVNRIEVEKGDNIQEVKYLEMIGFLEKPSTPLISRIENIGASFFGWDEGDTKRATHFLNTLGYYELVPLPSDQRTKYVDYGKTMPDWPESGSVKVVNNVVLVKFSDYSNKQIEEICTSQSDEVSGSDFCQ